MQETKTATLDPDLIKLLGLDRQTCEVIVEKRSVISDPNEKYSVIYCSAHNQRTPSGCRIFFLNTYRGKPIQGCPLRNQEKNLSHMANFGIKVP